MVGFGGTIGFANCMTVDSGDSTIVEEYYRRMIEENPSNPLFQRNYAQYLCEVVSRFPFLSFFLVPLKLQILGNAMEGRNQCIYN